MKVHTSEETMECIMAGVGYYLRTKTIVTFALLSWMLFGGVVGIGLWYFKDSLQIKKAEPIGAEFSLIPQAYAGGEPIIINGRTYGYVDPTVKVWKLAGESTLLLYDTKSGAIVRMDSPAMGDLKRYK